MLLRYLTTLTREENVCQQLVFPSIVILIGLLTMIGFVTKHQPLLILGYASAAAPLPLPFVDAWGKQENFAYNYTLLVDDGDQIHTLSAKSDLLHGPHKYKIGVMNAFVMAPNHRPLTRNALEFVICQQPDLIKKFPLHKNDVLSVEVRARDSRGNIKYSPKIVCPK